MIQANELRIGNWILFSPSGRKAAVKVRPVCVKELHQNTFIVKDKAFDLELFYESVGSQPIPLTPEILIAAGFEMTEYDSHKRNKIIVEYLPNIAAQFFFDFKKLITDDGWQICLEDNDKWDVWYGKAESWGERLPLCSIKFIHQLQNLYFALTGSELQIVLNSEQEDKRSVATEAASKENAGQIEFPNIPLRIIEGL